MNFPKIAFKVEDRVYRLDATDGPAIKKIPKQDREHLLTLLAAIKKQHELEVQASMSAAASINTEIKVDTSEQVKVAQLYQHKETELPENPGKSDIDQLMLRLAAEEKRNKKPFDKNKTYLYLGGATVFILFLLFMMI